MHERHIDFWRPRSLPTCGSLRYLPPTSVSTPKLNKYLGYNLQIHLEPLFFNMRYNFFFWQSLLEFRMHSGACNSLKAIDGRTCNAQLAATRCLAGARAVTRPCHGSNCGFTFMQLFTGNHYIDGHWIGDAGSGIYESLNPSDGTVVGTAPSGSTELARAAVAAARAAFEASDWASDPRLRAHVLLEFADRLEARSEEAATLVSRENGKVIGQARHEVAAGISEARYYAGLSRNIFGRTFESGSDKVSLLTREPAGVAAVIVPWNAPVTLLVRSVGPALAAGCTVVVKPAPQTPLSNALAIQCFAEVEGLPHGVINSINECGVEVGRELSTHPEVDVVSFTGSSATGKAIMANASATVKRLSLELGGKSPAIVFEDADLDAAVSEVRRSSITLNGQMCTAISRVLVQSGVCDIFAARLKSAYQSVVVGNPLRAGVELGPLIDKPNQKRILSLVDHAADEADLLLRGEAPGGELASGSFVTPTLFRIDDVSSRLIQDELFGPIVSIESFDDEQEAIDRANATRYGLASSVYTRDLNCAMRMGRRLKFGTVWFNSHNRLMAEAETGGYRESGVGRLHGVEALNDFLETKHIFCDAGF